MPSYDFECQDCGEKFTVFVPISKREDVTCTSCGKDRVRQLVTAFYHSGSSRGRGGSCCSDRSCASCSGCSTPHR